MERIVQRSDGTYGILVEASGGLPYQIIRDDGTGFKTPDEAEAMLKEIRESLGDLRRLRRPRDPIQLGKLIVDIATGQVKDQEPKAVMTEKQKSRQKRKRPLPDKAG